jgi:Domain of unknown function (DUF4345)
MKTVINILVVLCILPLVLLGVLNMVSPSSTFELYGVNPVGIMTYSTFRGAIGGMLIGGGLMMLMGLITKNKTWYHSTLLLISVILVGRIISVIVDGWTNAAIPAVGTEVFIVVVMYFAAKQLDTNTKK